ncbi:DUF1643 domain-containing protein [Kurthia sibirica]|uniref:DUF1643 domain-containing protein n=1 Tax=Kurthia sibirica TaxID=202750 RepID=A0A2U3AMK4_9BACL|nr:DUF1643 domain-containing protein [Kurthia sibirica]PWI25752.1 hypothetical protein DEX24_06000 [Kurthia sibirica]GEK35594.1 hypothetical protein KSI01_31270 [Kurthia sibirica]
MSKYPANVFVDYIDQTTIAIFGKKQDVRYSLTLDNMSSNSEYYASVLLMHPSAANRHTSDALTNQLIRFLSKKDYQEITILTYFPYKVAIAEELYHLISESTLAEVLRKNHKAIRQQIKRSTVFILAWGDRPTYIPKKQFDYALRLFKNMVIEEKCQHKIHLFTYSHADSLSVSGQPANPYRKYIETIEPFDIAAIREEKS